MSRMFIMRRTNTFAFYSVLVFLFLFSQSGFCGELALIPTVEIGGLADDDVLLSSVTDAAVDSRGNIYLADLGLSCVHKFDRDGVLLQKFGEAGTGPGDIPFGVIFTIDRNDRLYIAGMGGRVDILDTEWNYLRSFDRENSGAIPRSIRVAPNGTVVVAELDVLDQTTLSIYDKDFEFLRSFCDTYGAEMDLDWRVESLYAGGFADVGADGRIYYSQLAPYCIRVFSSEGALEFSITAGGDDFVLDPPVPEIDGSSFSVSYPWTSTGIENLSGGLMMCSSCRTLEDQPCESLLCVYDADLDLVARRLLPDLHVVVGGHPDGRVFLFSKDDDGIRVVLYEIEIH